ncbi:hypothetical protein HOA56_00090 [archaeon]|jgi:hypothetical protein|nr:hypothetical protein [archaeon]
MEKQTILQLIIATVIILIIGGIISVFIFPNSKIILALKEILLAKPYPYADADLIDKEAKDSMAALLYTVNRISWFDKYYGRNLETTNNIDFSDLDKEFQMYDPKTGSQQPIGSFKSFERSYGDTDVVPTLMESYVVPISGSVNSATLDLAKYIYDCRLQAEDVARRNIRCFSGDFEKLVGTIKEEDIIEGLERFSTTSNCDKTCQDYVKDILGTNINFVKNIEIDVQGEGITRLNSLANGKTIQICYDNNDDIIPWNDNIYITDQMIKCSNPEDALRFTFRINNFNFPQKVTQFSGFKGFAQSVLSHYGDPYYIAFYEQFPEGEDSTWNTHSFSSFGTLSVDGVFILLRNLIPGKLDNILFSTNVRKLMTRAILKLLPQSANIADEIVDSNYGKRLENTAKNEFGDESWAKAEYNELFIIPYEKKYEEYLVVKYSGLNFLFSNFDNLIEKHELSTYSTKNDEYYNAFMELINKYSNENLLFESRLNKNFLEDLKVKFNNIVNEKEFNDDLIFELKDFIEFNSYDYEFLSNIADDINYKIIGFSEEIKYGLENGESKNSILQNINKEMTMMENEIKSYKSGLTSKKEDLFMVMIKSDIITAMAINKQNNNKRFSNYIDSNFNDKAIDNKFNEIFGSENYDVGRNDKRFSDLTSSSELRKINTKIIAEFLIKTNSIGDKFKGIGVNSIGFKTPYRASVTYDDTFTKNWKWPQDKDKYFDYFENFAGYTDEEQVTIVEENHENGIDGENCNSRSYIIGKDSWYVGETYCGEQGNSIYEDYQFQCHSAGNNQVRITKAYCEKGCDISKRVCKGAPKSCKTDSDCPDKQYCDITSEPQVCKLKQIYNSKKYNGLLPEVEEYFLALQGDQHYWIDQSIKRFHIVSPCKADMMVKVTQCECYGGPEDPIDVSIGPINLIDQNGKYETGKYNPTLDEIIPHFDGKNPSLYSINPDTGAIIKECIPPNIFEKIAPWAQNTYKPLCIEINPVLDKNQQDNYCYKGTTPPGLIPLDIALRWVLPVTCFGATAATGPGAILATAACDVVGELTYSTIENKCTHWPIHGMDPKGENEFWNFCGTT